MFGLPMRSPRRGSGFARPSRGRSRSTGIGAAV